MASIRAIANELNHLAQSHRIGGLQQIRGTVGPVFRVNSNTTQQRWACHWGGRKELQFNIGIDDSSWLRYGIAFSFEQSRNYQASELIEILRPRVMRFNRYARDNSRVFRDMEDLWAYDTREGAMLGQTKPGPIPMNWISEHVFIFAGSYEPIRRINFKKVLGNFDELLPLYQYVMECR